MPKLGYYVKGDYNAACDECGLGYKFSGLRLRWDSAWVCRSCWEPRQPQDFLRSVKDDSSVPIGRPRLGVPTMASAEWQTSAGFTASWVTSSGLPSAWTN